MKRPKTGQVILVVEDDGDIRAATEEILAYEGYRPLCVGTVQEALALLGQRPSLILLDLMTPDLDPAVFFHALGESPAANVPVVAVGAQRSASPSGVRHFLRKPYSVEGLLALLERLALP